MPTLTLIKPQFGHPAGHSIEILDETIAKAMIANGDAREAGETEITIRMNKAIDALGARVAEQLEKALAGFANSMTKSRKNGTPDIFGAGDGDRKKTFGAWLLALRTGDRKALEAMGSQWEPWQKAIDMTGNIGAAGGFLVPTEHYQEIMEVVIQYAIMREYAWIIPQVAKRIEVPTVDITDVPSAGNNAMLGGIVLNWTEDAAAETGTRPSLKQIALENYELTGYTYISNTLAEDMGQGMEAVLLNLFGKAIAWTEDYAFFNGNGAGKPLGVLNSGALKTVTRSGANAFAMSDYANMLAALTPNVNEEKTFWACSPTAAAQVYQLVAGNQLYLGNFQQSPNASPTAQRNLGGVALHKTDMLPALDTVGDILLINGDGYIIGDRQSMSIAYSEGPRFTNNEMTWRFVHRVGGRTWYNKPITMPDATTTVSHFVALSHV